MKSGDTVKVTETMYTEYPRVITGTVDGFSMNFDYVFIKQGDKIEQVFLSDIVELVTITSVTKKMSGKASKIGVPSV